MKLDLPDIPAPKVGLNGPEDTFPAIPDRLCRLDEYGMLIAPEESPDGFRARLDAMRTEIDYALPPDAQEIPSGIREAAERNLIELYGIRPTWVPAYLSARETGHFSAGVTALLFPENGNKMCIPLIFLSGAFQKKSRHFGYDAVETLAHEMVHAVRSGAGFPDSAYEEHFPCQVHASRFRRLAGNLFRKWQIPVLFFGGLTFAALHPAFLLTPALVLLREIQLHLRIRAAAEKLRELHLRPEPVLLRLTDSEIKMLGKGKIPAFLEDSDSLRRNLLFQRFPLS